MNDNTDVRIKIKEELKKGFVFSLHSNQPIDIVLRFVGYQHEALQLMQTLSHGTRAYILNANSFVKILQDADQDGTLKKASEWQHIDFQNVVTRLEYLETEYEQLEFLQ